MPPDPFAAGVCFIDGGNFLLVQNTDDKLWQLPGGMIEAGETPRVAAIREIKEELNVDLTDLPEKFHTDKQGFVTFFKKTPYFEPVLNDESCAYQWVNFDNFPNNLHPELAESLHNDAYKQHIVSDSVEEKQQTELDVAKKIRDGELPSPQYFGNVWLFNIRITGTGVTYRSKDDEFAYRPPEHYMNDVFLQRCNGLQVILNHPNDGTLTSDEFKGRTIGSVFLPYLKNESNEVWAIAKVYDDDAAQVMISEELSTSPTVVFKKLDKTSIISLEDGTALLIENDPVLLDHVAICKTGVWDKGGVPSGVSSDRVNLTNGVENMDMITGDATAVENQVEPPATEDKFAEMMILLQGLAQKVEALSAAKTEVADEKEEIVEKKEEDSEIKKRIDAVEAMIPKAVSDEDYAALADAQCRADSLATAFGASAPRPQMGENALGYRKRVLAKFKQHSASYKDVDINKIDDNALFNIVENQIYNDALTAANNPAQVQGQGLREIKTRTPAGHQISTFKGPVSSWMNQFKADAFRVTKLETGVK